VRIAALALSAILVSCNGVPDTVTVAREGAKTVIYSPKGKRLRVTSDMLYTITNEGDIIRCVSQDVAADRLYRMSEDGSVSKYEF
jgi:dTDP-4-dehydrorhamnose reductase